MKNLMLLAALLCAALVCNAQPRKPQKKPNYSYIPPPIKNPALVREEAQQPSATYTYYFPPAGYAVTKDTQVKVAMHFTYSPSHSQTGRVQEIYIAAADTAYYRQQNDPMLTQYIQYHDGDVIRKGSGLTFTDDKGNLRLSFTLSPANKWPAKSLIQSGTKAVWKRNDEAGQATISTGG